MSHIQVLDSGLVYRNPVPHIRSRHAYFPSAVELASGELIVAMDLGSAFEAIDVRSFLCRSNDDGKTWSGPQPIFTPDESERPISTSCRISAVDGERLVGLACLFDRSRAELGLANPATDGFVRTEFALLHSRDGGTSWTGPQPVTLPIDWNEFEICSPIHVLRSGRWLLPTATWPAWDGANRYGCKAITMLSDDQGANWSRCVDVMNQWSDRIGHYEQKQIVLSDGRIMAVCWTIDHVARSNRRNRYAFSTNDGEKFSTSLEAPLHGETCTPLALPGNHVLCVYRRMDQKGLWAHLARIDGATWVPLADLPLWGANVSAHDEHQSSLLAQMSTLRFGCPSVVRRRNGEIFVVFWCVEDCVSNIRWIRLNVC